MSAGAAARLGRGALHRPLSPTMAATSPAVYPTALRRSRPSSLIALGCQPSPSGPRPSRPSLSTKAPCSLPALRFGEHDRPRDGVVEPEVISASAVQRAGDEGREA